MAANTPLHYTKITMMITKVKSKNKAANGAKPNVSGSLPPSVTEDEVWTELSDNFRKVAHSYKDGHFDYRFVFAWFQEQQLKYELKRRQFSPTSIYTKQK